jgi:hypothetical protein
VAPFDSSPDNILSSLGFPCVDRCFQKAIFWDSGVWRTR